MGKKGNWFSAIKRVFIPDSKEKPVNGPKNKSTKEKKKGQGILSHGETKSFIPLFRGPSSIEKILGEADQQKLLIRPHTPLEEPKTPPLLLPRAASSKVTSPRVTSPRAASPKVTSPRVTSPRAVSSRAVNQNEEFRYRPEPTLSYRNISATKIQAAYRGYMARRSFRSLRGLARLQGVVRGHNVKRQTVNAMKTMQLLVRAQTQIQLRRIQMLENQVLQRQAHKNDKELESTLSKCTMSQSEAGLHEEWDDSVLTKEEIEARLRRKAEAIIKRERTMAYAYSQQLWKANPKSAQMVIMDIRSGGFPWWWTWLDRQLPRSNPPESQTAKSFHLTPPRPALDPKPSPRPAFNNYKQGTGFDNLESLTPWSTRSPVPMRSNKHLHTPSSGTPTNSSILMKKYPKPRPSAVESAFDLPMKDDDSLMSCPPFSVPSYMTPTVSAKAKVKGSSDPNDGFPGTPSGDSNRRFSFTPTPSFGSFKRNKGSSKDSASQRLLEKHRPLQSTGDLSIDSTASMPAALGRKPFNRFV
ncbi:Protein IQ-DOMAIN like [Actinidia chinensis var. chinensis]|uniref:Protein IQ-DOMAIN like n=1 Tax=Actinidia chinensis var. chinensis TaxID=1590841 RepID=A0A2R6RXS1_ACTCC|nr:Protein IQ-DOMAIN like [Actinidia chinensis var. chinensis]